MKEFYHVYEEEEKVGNSYRVQQTEELDQLISKKRQEANKARDEFFKPDLSSIHQYEESIESYRNQFKAMLGWPLVNPPEVKDIPEIELTYVTEDSLGTIYRLTVEAMEGLTTYGLLFLPTTTGPYPLMIAQHGGRGTPEVCSGFHNQSGNYNQMVRRFLDQGFAVFAPQLLLWDKERYGREYDRQKKDQQLKQLGSSITAIEIYKIQRALDYLLSRKDIDETKVGMVGLSYGGFYTLYTSAIDTRIKATLSSCYFNDRFVYDWSDYIWFNSGNIFLDPEIASLICPRPLYIEVGTKDQIFLFEHIKDLPEQVRRNYEQLGIKDKFRFVAHDLGHEFDKADDGIEFIKKQILY